MPKIGIEELSKAIVLHSGLADDSLVEIMLDGSSDGNHNLDALNINVLSLVTSLREISPSVELNGSIIPLIAALKMAIDASKS